MGSSQSSLALSVKLSGKGIKDLEKDLKQPRLLPAFPKLETIDLSKNKIDHIPPSIQQDVQKSPLVIEHLAVLDLSKNRLSEVPECVYLLINLKDLNMAGNELVSISDRLLTFYRLRRLILNKNKLRRLPYAMNRLHALRVLAIEDNELTYLPNTIARLEYIEEITYLPNPFADPTMHEDFDDMRSLLRFLRNQKVPPTYLDEARRALELEKEKEEKLTADQRIVRDLLKYKEGLEELEKWMTKEHSVENLSFYKEVRRFRKKYNSTVEIRTTELVTEAKAIFDKFISPNAPHQVNLPAEATANCIKMFTDSFNFPRGINQFIFEDAYKASFELMVSDTFQRFRLSEIGRDLLTQLEKIQRKRKQ